MTNELIKVDRVRSAEEAVELERLGAAYIGVWLDLDPRFDDDRHVYADTAAAIRKSLRHARLVVGMDLADDPRRVVEIAGATGAALVQPVSNAIPAAAVRDALRDAGIGIVYGGIEIAHDDDPGWIFGAYDETPELNAAFFQAEVLPEYRDSWAFLRDRAPEYDDEFQIADLEELARERPLFVGLPGDLREISAALPSVRGYVFTLAERARRGDARFHAYADVVRALTAS